MGIVGPVDHENGNGLDCRRSNLRPGPSKLNHANQRKTTSKTTSPYKGVCWFALRNKWLATIRFDGRKQHLGLFTDEEQAARAYDAAALTAWESTPS